MSSTYLNTAVPLPQNVEPWVCQHCLGLNSVEAKPNHRRPKQDFHMYLEEPVYLALKARCTPFHTMNNGITMLMYELDKYRMMDNKAMLKQAVQVRNIDEITKF